MSSAHLLAITSLKDLTSTVLVEGLSLGLPIVSPDHCGFSDAVTEHCGIKIAPRNVDALIRGFASAIIMLASEEDKRYALARGAIERARDYIWDAKTRDLDRIYRSVLDGASAITSPR